MDVKKMLKVLESIPDDSFERTIFYLSANLQNCLKMQSMQSYRLTCAYFIIGSLSLLKVFDDQEQIDKLPFTKEQIIDWVYSFQIEDENSENDSDQDESDSALDHNYHGFRGDDFYSIKKDSKSQTHIHQGDFPHLANTYSAICVLKMLGDDLSRVNCEQIIQSLKYFQKEDGRIQCLPVDSEDDVRFAYCAAAIHKMMAEKLGDLDIPPSFDVDKMIEFYKNCLSYDGGFGWFPESESHAGLTYCLLGAFKCLGRLDDLSDDKERIIEWLVSRQCMETNGFQGRVNKIPDTCYCFWNSASLAILDNTFPTEFVHKESITEFCEDCKRFGGYAKLVFSEFPDIVHTYYTLAFYSLIEDERLNKLDPLLAIPQTKLMLPT
ncbi:unnamed protein product [Moneuplotes crassus]|uniref:Prenyltransferase alpha-alpha toroid domain-containing protein n=1 Tax=Euplotes crassus TaxID=5936 RepID=A0AAD1UDY3_EUPCR|nr:unnamed protein product [Moneuplotes crassus]